jgi:hypothetical protein
MAWTCESCGRQFARARQSHGCSPALNLDEYFSTGPAFERPIFETVAAHLLPLGARVEAVQVGIFFKKARTFVELRPMRDRVRLSMLLSRRLEDRRVVKRLGLSGRRFAVYVDLRTPEEVDVQLRSWLTESYLSSPD